MSNKNNMFKNKNPKLKERVNLDMAVKLNKINFTQFSYLFNLSKVKRKLDYNIMGEYKKLKNYCESIIKTKNNHIVNYGYVDGKEGVGRLQAKVPSLQRLYTGFRAVLCDNYMIDIDMVNCHPKILLNLCKKHDIKYNYLLDYINKRDDILCEFMSEHNVNRGVAKSSFLSSLNKVPLTYQVNNKKVKEKSFFRKFDKELSNITTELFNIYKDDEKYNNFIKDDYNKEGKYINLILCDIENDYLQIALKFIKDDYRAVLMYDGFMFDASIPVDKVEILNKLNERFIVYNMSWVYKDHDIELLEHINNLNIEEVDIFIGDNIICIIDHILDGILKDKIYKDEFTKYYITDDKIIMNEASIKASLYDLLSKQNYEMFDAYKGKDGSIVNCSKIHRHLNDIVAGILNKCPTNMNFINNIWDNSRFKLYFKNGIYDFNKNKFLENDKNINKTFIKINYNFNSKKNDNVRNEIYKKVLYPVFSIRTKEEDPDQYELMKYFLFICSQMVAGNVELKRWLLFEGLRNSGKGVLGDLLKNCFGAYIKTTNSNNFNFKTNIQDSQKALSWLIDYRFTRIALTSEMDIGNDIKLNGNMIKKFTSGGDCLSARLNFQDEIEFKIQSSLIIMCNDMPKIEPNDALEYCDEFQMKSKFIDDDFNDENKLEGFRYYKKENDIKSVFLKRRDVLDEFILMIFEMYDTDYKFPINIKKINDDNIKDENDYENLFNMFEFTQNRNGFFN